MAKVSRMASKQSSFEEIFSARALLTLFFSFVVFHLGGIGRHGFWIDETITGGLTFLSSSEIIIDRLGAGHFPTYFLFMKYWGALFGISETSLRVPSLICMSLAFAGLWLLLKRFFSIRPGVALLVLLLFFFHPTVLRLAQEARMYGPLLCLTIYSTYYFLIFIERREYRPLILCALFLVVAICIHIQAFLLLFSQMVFLLLRHRRLFPRYLSVVCPPVIVFLVLWYEGSSLYTSGTGSYEMMFIPSAAGVVLRTPGPVAAGETDSFIFSLLPALEINPIRMKANLLFWLFLASALYDFSRCRREEGTDGERAAHSTRYRTAFLYLVCLLVVFYGIMVFIGCVGLEQIEAVRYYVTVLPALLIIVAAGAVSLGDFLQKSWSASLGVEARLRTDFHWTGQTGPVSFMISRVLAGCLITVFIYIFLYSLNHEMNWLGPGYGEAILQLKEVHRDNEPVITCCQAKMRYGFEYYGAAHIDNRLRIMRPESEEHRLITRKMRRITGDSDRVWILLYRNINPYRKRTLRAFAEANPDYRLFYNKRYPVTQLLGFEKIREEGEGCR